VTHRVLETDDATAAVRAHLLSRPTVSARTSPDLWNALKIGDDALRRALTNTPVVGFRPERTIPTGG
jgi:hypothetical protein